MIQGRYPWQTSFRSLEIVASPSEKPPFPVDAVVFEEDTFLVLSADRHVRDPHLPLMRVMTKVIETRPEIPGSVLVKGTRPARLLAIVHDLNQEPSWREKWVASALKAIFREAKKQRFTSIALPFLGNVYGSLDRERFVVLLRNVMEQSLATHPKRLWLVVPKGTDNEILELLRPEPR